MTLVEEIFNPLAWSEGEVMLLAEGAHGIDGIASAFFLLLTQNQLFPGDGFQSAFDDFFRRSAEAAGEGGLDDLGAVRREVDLHGGRIARARSRP
jgi:hypothetical protein